MNDNQQINLFLSKEDGVNIPEIVIRNGEALPLKEPNIINFKGAIESPFKWLQGKLKDYDASGVHVKVNRELKQIVLVLDEKSAYSTTITGELVLTKIFNDFGINTGKFFTTKQLASFFKMNRSYFTSKTAANELVNQLASFVGKIEGAIEKVTDSGKKRELSEKVVKSNLPETFELFLPIFKGRNRQTFEVEFYLDVDNYSLQLNSPHAADLIAETVDQAIDEVIHLISEKFPEIVILEE